MDAVRRLIWWGIAYGSVGCLWVAAEVKADLSGQPESADDSVAVVIYEPIHRNSPADNTLATWLDADATFVADQ
jgi:hypothetical protein